jgi:hypothetical protein
MSAYFTYFPTTENDLEQNGSVESVTNILRRFKVKNSVKDRLDVYYDYQIRAGDRPDTIAEKYYGSSAHAWIVLHYNDIIDPIFDWPLFNQDLDNYIKSKYGSIAAAQASVYEYRRILTPKQTLVDGTIVQERYVVIDKTTYDTLGESEKQSISSYDYELEKNEQKRIIKILDNKYLNQIIGEVEDILRNGL